MKLGNELVVVSEKEGFGNVTWTKEILQFRAKCQLARLSTAWHFSAHTNTSTGAFSNWRKPATAGLQPTARAENYYSKQLTDFRTTIFLTKNST